MESFTEFVAPESVEEAVGILRERGPATCVLVAILAWFSWPMWWEAVVTKERSESLWSPPMWIPYFFLPFGMTLLLLQYIVYIGRKIRALQRGDIAAEAERAEIKDLEIPGTEQRPDE